MASQFEYIEFSWNLRCWSSGCDSYF